MEQLPHGAVFAFPCWIYIGGTGGSCQRQSDMKTEVSQGHTTPPAASSPLSPLESQALLMDSLLGQLEASGSFR